MAQDFSKADSAAAIRYADNLSENFPDYAKLYINQKKTLLAAKTAKAYASDMNVFLSWVYARYPEKCSSVASIPLDLIVSLKPMDLTDFVNYLTYDKERENSNAAINRKFVTIRQFYDFLFDNDFYSGKNPVRAVKLKKVKSAPDYEHLSDDEVVLLLSYILNSHSDVAIEETYKNKTRSRDFTIIVTMLGTGLRVSELVGLDIDDINFNICKLRVVRKGKADQDSAQYVYMNDNVVDALKDYLPARRAVLKTKHGDEKALFLSSQNARIGVSTIEIMLKKHIKACGIDRNISPHKLRKTYGMRLYNDGTDIYVVSKLLGHSDVKVTTQHYVEPSNEKLEQAREKDTLYKITPPWEED